MIKKLLVTSLLATGLATACGNILAMNNTQTETAKKEKLKLLGSQASTETLNQFLNTFGLAWAEQNFDGTWTISRHEKPLTPMAYFNRLVDKDLRDQEIVDKGIQWFESPWPTGCAVQ